MTAVEDRRIKTLWNLAALVTLAAVIWLMVMLFAHDLSAPTAIVPKGSHPGARSSEQL